MSSGTLSHKPHPKGCPTKHNFLFTHSLHTTLIVNTYSHTFTIEHNTYLILISKVICMSPRALFYLSSFAADTRTPLSPQMTRLNRRQQQPPSFVAMSLLLLSSLKGHTMQQRIHTIHHPHLYHHNKITNTYDHAYYKPA